MQPKKDDGNDYYVYFRGARLNKRDANRAGLGAILGFFGVFGVFFFSLEKFPVLAVFIVTLCALIGYVIGVKIFK